MMMISYETERPEGATGVHWTETDWTECFAIIDATVSGYGDAASGEFVSDQALTGDEDCACDGHADVRQETTDR